MKHSYLSTVNWELDKEYLNTTLDEYKDIYPAEISDYIIKDNFDIVRVILL